MSHFVDARQAARERERQLVAVPSQLLACHCAKDAFTAYLAGACTTGRSDRPVFLRMVCILPRTQDSNTGFKAACTT